LDGQEILAQLSNDEDCKRRKPSSVSSGENFEFAKKKISQLSGSKGEKQLKSSFFGGAMRKTTSEGALF